MTKPIPPDSPVIKKQTNRGVRRSISRTHASISLTSGLLEWVQQSAEERGIGVSAFIEQELRKARDRAFDPIILREDKETGKLYAVRVRED